MLIILPGWMHDARQWDTITSLLNNMNIEHVVLDFPGFGTVPKDDTIATFDDLVRWTESEIKKITIDKDAPLTLLGHSCGGRVALALAKDSNLYQQLILIGSPNLYRPSRKVQLVKILTKLVSPIKAVLPKSLQHKLRSTDYNQAKSNGMEDLYKSVVANDQTAIAREIKTTVHLLWGEKDTAAPVSIAYELHEFLPHSTLTVVPNLGHNIHHENPRLLVGKIKLLLQND